MLDSLRGSMRPTWNRPGSSSGMLSGMAALAPARFSGAAAVLKRLEQSADVEADPLFAESRAE